MLSTPAAAALLSVLLGCAHAGDPSPGWLTYAQWTTKTGRITMLNTSWVVPTLPADRNPQDAGAPGWWFGIQTAEGDGALVQPILAWGYLGAQYTMFNGVFDWTDTSWHTSPEKITVKPGDKLVSSVVYQPRDNSYTMYIRSTQLGKTIATNYKIEAKQTANETTAYFVLEHAPKNCAALPADGVCTFEDIYMEVDGKQVTPSWEPVIGKAAKCGSKTTSPDSKTIKISWDAKSASTATGGIEPLPRKWGADAHGQSSTSLWN